MASRMRVRACAPPVTGQTVFMVSAGGIVVGRFHYINFERKIVGIILDLFFEGVIISVNDFYLRRLGVYI